LTNVQLVKVKNEKAKIKYDIVNTGRMPIMSSSANRLSKSVVIEFEDALKNCQCQLVDFQDAIRYQVYFLRLNLPVGKTVKNKYMEFSTTNIAPPAMVMYKPKKEYQSFKKSTPKKKEEPIMNHLESVAATDNKEETFVKSKEATTIIQNEDQYQEPINTEVVEAPKVIEETFVKSEEVPTATEVEIQETIITEAVTSEHKVDQAFVKSEEVPTTTEIEIQETIITEAVTSDHKVEETFVKSEEVPNNKVQEKWEEDVFAATESQENEIIDLAENASGQTITTATTIPSNNRTIEPEAVVSSEISSENLAEAEIKENVEILLEEEASLPKKKLCSDLMLTDIKILKQSKSYTSIEYTLTNYGEAPAKIANYKSDTGQVFAIKAFLSRSGQLTRGALPIGGMMIRKLAENKEGMLDPNSSYTGVIKLDIRKKTRFTPNLILTIDPYLSITECDRTNNTGFVNLDEEKELFVCLSFRLFVFSSFRQINSNPPI